MAPLPLDGITVISVEQAVSAPLASRHLADLGARVIKIERPGSGDFARHYDDVVHGMSTYFVWLNRSKESVALDIRSDRGRALLEQLLERADVFIENLAPGAATRLDLDATQVHARHPRIIACDMSGFGHGGPDDQRRAYDLVVQAEAASISITGSPGHLAKPGIAVSDIAAGMYTYSSVLAALLQRHQTGRGSSLSVSMLDATAEWMSYSTYLTAYSGNDHVPFGIGHHAIVPYGAYPTADGTQIVLAVQNEREWSRLATRILKSPELQDDDRMSTPTARVAHRGLIDQLIAAAIVQLSEQEARDALDAAGIANGRLNSVDDLLNHPQLLARSRWRKIDTPGGSAKAILPPPVSSSWDPVMGRVPALGEHSRAVLSELGTHADEIDRLIAQGVVQAPGTRPITPDHHEPRKETSS